MENVQAFIDNLDWNEYKALWSKFWIHKLGFDPNKNGFAKVVVKLPKEEVWEKDKFLEESFLSFVKSNISHDILSR